MWAWTVRTREPRWVNPVALALTASATAGLGAVGGLGGAVLLVPALVVTGTPAAEAAPLGLVSVGAGSIAAGAAHLAERTVHHRLGVATELVASTGAIAGALTAGAVSESVLTRALAVVAVIAAVAGGRRSGVRNRPDPNLGPEHIGERPGRLAGAYPLGTQVVPWEARRLRSGFALVGLSGIVAGMAGVSGGFIRTPAASEILHVPVKVAAATTTFTVGVTAATGLLVMAVQGRIDVHVASVVAAASIVGGRFGARLQGVLAPTVMRRVLALLLVAVAGVLLVGG
jgi:uncharacterized membrane protein YfcA